MLYARINNTDLMGSKIVLGSDQFGSAIPTEESFQILDHYFEAGGNIIDTASVYANWLTMGESLSEKTIGKWMEQRRNRDEIIISTKGGHFDLDTGRPRLSYDEVRGDLEKSFLNLKTDYIDLYWLHKDDEEQEPEALIEMVNKVADDAHVGYFGVSNWKYSRIKKANEYAKKRGLRRFVASQIQYSIAKVNRAEKGIVVMDETEYKNYISDELSVFCFASQARGFFTKTDKYGVEALPQGTREMYLNDRNMELLNNLQEFARKESVSISGIVLSALLSDDRLNTFALIGPKKVMDLKEALKDSDRQLTSEERTKLLYGNTYGNGNESDNENNNESKHGKVVETIKETISEAIIETVIDTIMK